jgi:flagellar motor switch protein FliM
MLWVYKKVIYIGVIGLHRFKKWVKITERISSDRDEVQEILKKIEQERIEKMKNPDNKKAINE